MEIIMKKRLALVFLTVICTLCFFGCDKLLGGITGSTDVPDIKTVKTSVVKVETEFTSGSGFCAINENYIITSYHIIENGGKIYVTNDKGEKSEIEEIVLYDKEKDIAILKTKEAFTPLKLGSGSRVKVKDELTLISSPMGVLNTVTKGIVSNDSYKGYIVVSTPASPGSSGGAVLNSKHEVVGVIKGTANDEYAQNLNLAINVDELKKISKDCEDGKYKKPKYPESIVIPEEKKPKSLGSKYFSYDEESGSYSFLFSLIGKDGSYVKYNTEVRISIKDDYGNVLYNETVFVSESDFHDGDDHNEYKHAVIEIQKEKLKGGETPFGKGYYTVITENKTLGNDSGYLAFLPIKDTPFTTITLSGTEYTTYENVNIPYGYYRVQISYEGDQSFSFALDGISYLTSTEGPSFDFIMEPKDNRHAPLGTPYKNEILFVGASGNWTVTITRIDPPKE